MQSSETSQFQPTNNAVVDSPLMGTAPYGSTMNASTPKRKIKLSLIVGAIIAATVIAAIIILVAIFNGTGDSSPSQLNMGRPVKVVKDNKYGFIDTDGNWLVEPRYDAADDFYGGFAMVSTESFDESGSKIIESQLIDRNGNVQAMTKNSCAYCDIRHVDEAGVWLIYDQVYDASLKKLSSDDMEVQHAGGKYFSWENDKENTAGIMDATGKITYTYHYAGEESYFDVDYETVDESLASRYCAITVDNEKYGIVNCDTGKLIYGYTNNYLYNEGDNIFTETVEDSREFVSIMYVQDDKIAYQSFSEDVELLHSPGYIWIDDDSKSYGEQDSYFDIASGQITKTKPEVHAKSTLEKYTGYTEFQCASGYGLMSGETVVVPCEWTRLVIVAFDPDMYQYLKSLGKEYIFGTKDGAVSLIDARNGQVVTTFNSNSIENFGDSIFISYKDRDTGEKVIYNLVTDKSMRTDGNHTIYRKPNYIIIDNGKWSYYNSDFKLIYTE